MTWTYLHEHSIHTQEEPDMRLARTVRHSGIRAFEHDTCTAAHSTHQEGVPALWLLCKVHLHW